MLFGCSGFDYGNHHPIGISQTVAVEQRRDKVMPHNADIDKRAKELYELSGAPLNWDDLDEDMLIRVGFVKIAKHVESLLIDRAIEELEWILREGTTTGTRLRITKLRQQKEAL
jgi:hypothetical protein